MIFPDIFKRFFGPRQKKMYFASYIYLFRANLCFKLSNVEKYIKKATTTKPTAVES